MGQPFPPISTAAANSRLDVKDIPAYLGVPVGTKELEQIEDHWRQESHELIALVTRLRDENLKLGSSLADQQNYSPDIAAQAANSEVDAAVMHRLRHVIDELREKLRIRDKDLGHKATEVDNLSSQVERLTMVGRELRRKHRGGQVQVRNLIDERADFLAQLQDQQRELVILRQCLGLAQKENEDLAKSHLNAAADEQDDKNLAYVTKTT
uniref:Uncharacterized protein n=1 Tax=Timema poppense TaxID=170557 RepID=A0A7R9CV93_TIMPO|nr:unnamed protein product [Timema poppensis]